MISNHIDSVCLLGLPEHYDIIHWNMTHKDMDTRIKAIKESTNDCNFCWDVLILSWSWRMWRAWPGKGKALFRWWLKIQREVPSCLRSDWVALRTWPIDVDITNHTMITNELTKKTWPFRLVRSRQMSPCQSRSGPGEDWMRWDTHLSINICRKKNAMFMNHFLP